MNAFFDETGRLLYNSYGLMHLLNMRTLLNNVSFLIIFFFFITCKSRESKNETVLSEAKTSGIDTIHIDLDTISTNFKFKDLFSHVEVILLQTTEKSKVEYCQKVIVNENNISNYVLFDARQLSLFSFDSIGNFVHKSPLHIKESKYEFIHPWFFSQSNLIYNPYDSLYEFLFGNISKYDSKTLKYIKKEKYNLNAEILSAFIPLNNDLYVFYAISNKSTEEWGDSIFFYSISKDSIIKKQKLLQQIETLHSLDSPFLSFKNRFFYLPQIISNTIYEIHTDSLSIVPFIVMDYGKKTLNENNIDDFYKERNKWDYHELFKSSNYAYLKDMFQNNKSYWFFSLFYGKIFVTVYDKTEKTIHTADAGSIASYIPLLTDDILYCAIDTSQIKEVIDSGILTEENVNLLSKVKTGVNWVILKCYLK